MPCFLTLSTFNVTVEGRLLSARSRGGRQCPCACKIYCSSVRGGLDSFAWDGRHTWGTRLRALVSSETSLAPPCRLCCIHRALSLLAHISWHAATNHSWSWTAAGERSPKSETMKGLKVGHWRRFFSDNDVDPLVSPVMGFSMAHPHLKVSKFH